ncbi:MAG: hypothetical protein P8K10_04010 [Crocinitomicaceae bacterium]|nr:hypothetical protein [Crocinitomicaceae bacterium]
MSSQGIKYLNRLQRLKKVGQPIIIFLDKIRVFRFIVPVINVVIRKLNIKKQFQRDLNYRLIGRAFNKNKFPVKNNAKKVILFPFFSGGNNIFFLINLAIGYRLTKKGHRSIYLVCDNAIPICSNERVHKTRHTDRYLCYNCSKPYHWLKKITQAEIIYISDYLDKKELDKASIEIENLKDLKSLLKFQYDDIEIGKLVEKSVMRYFLIGKIEENNQTILVYQKFIKSIISLHISLKTLTKTKPELVPEKIILYNGTLSLEGYYRLWAQKKNIEYVTQETYIGQDSWIYKKNDEVMKLRWNKEWDEFKEIDLSTHQQEKAISYLEGLSQGKEMYDRLNYDYELDNDIKNKDFVVLFTNLNFDTAVLGRNPIFNSMKEWIDQTINYWIDNKPRQLLVIRVHPAEAKLLKPTNDFIGIYLKEINDKIKNANIKIYEAHDKVSSYELIKFMKAGLVYSSTIGIEIAYNNKPCLIAGDAFYKDQDFVYSSVNQINYFRLLKSLLSNENEKSINRTDLLQFVYFIYFNRVKRLKGINIDHANHINSFSFDSIEELIHLNNDVFTEFENEILT